MSKSTNTAYLAALVDGEGSIGIAQNRNSTFVRLIVTGTNETLANWLLYHFGGNVQWRTLQDKPNWKPEFTWRLTHNKAERLIAKIEPFLQIKWPQAALALSHRAVRDLPGNKVSCGYRKGWTFVPETQKALSFVQDAMKMFNARGANVPDPWSFVNRVAEGEI